MISWISRRICWVFDRFVFHVFDFVLLSPFYFINIMGCIQDFSKVFVLYGDDDWDILLSLALCIVFLLYNQWKGYCVGGFFFILGYAICHLW